ncbi:hypothetical protein SteCoe_36597 [Stentor coeruleus]|uniref:VWFA domain-containing protein n=1 Tax=Stentor coeruleus TaxID=5963 RepID=A0A1R2APR4_9CILI|nr:hypothetical protein SteCoe_36597 [Stentor coeruleus]
MGGTNILSALTAIYHREVEPDTLRFIFFITDGGDFTKEDSLKLIREKKGNTRICTIGINSSDIDFKFLEEAAKIGNGMSININKIEEISMKMIDQLDFFEKKEISELKINNILETDFECVPPLLSKQIIDYKEHVIYFVCKNFTNDIIISFKDEYLQQKRNLSPSIYNIENGVELHKIFGAKKIQYLEECLSSDKKKNIPKSNVEKASKNPFNLKYYPEKSKEDLIKEIKSCSEEYQVFSKRTKLELVPEPITSKDESVRPSDAVEENKASLDKEKSGIIRQIKNKISNLGSPKNNTEVTVVEKFSETFPAKFIYKKDLYKEQNANEDKKDSLSSSEEDSSSSSEISPDDSSKPPDDPSKPSDDPSKPSDDPSKPSEIKELPEECKLLTRKVIQITENLNEVMNLFCGSIHVLWKDTIILFPTLLLFSFRLPKFSITKDITATIFILGLLEIHYPQFQPEWENQYNSAIEWLTYKKFEYFTNRETILEIIISIYSTSQNFPDLIPKQPLIKANFELILLLLKIHNGLYWNYHIISAIFPSIEKFKFNIDYENLNIKSTVYILSVLKKFFAEFECDWNFMYLLSKKWLKSHSIDADKEISLIIEISNIEIGKEKNEISLEGEFSESVFNEINKIFHTEGYWDFQNANLKFPQLASLMIMHKEKFSEDTLATLFIINILETKYYDKVYEWRIIRKKAENWLKNKGVQLKNIGKLFEGFRSVFSYRLIQSQLILNRYWHFILVLSASNGVYWEFSVGSQLFSSLGMHYYKNCLGQDQDAFTTIIFIKYLEEYYSDELLEWTGFIKKAIKWLKNVKKVDYETMKTGFNCYEILKVPNMITINEALEESEVITAKLMFDHCKYEYATIIISDCDAFFRPYMRNNEEVMQEISMNILLKVTQKSLASCYQVFDVSESNMRVSKYSMADLVQICGSKADSYKELLSFCISYTSMTDLKKITSHFVLKTSVFLLFSVIAQKGKLSIYIGRTRNFWIISNPLIEKKLFESLGEALSFIIKQGFVLKIVNYLKAGYSSEKEIWKKNELEDLDKYMLEVEEIKEVKEANVKRKNTIFNQKKLKKSVENFFDKMNEKCCCELCDSFVDSGNSFSRFKKYI